MASKARAYAEQARADYDAYAASGEADESSLGEHHRLQLLQMALEKLASVPHITRSPMRVTRTTLLFPPSTASAPMRLPKQWA